jgi:hypothetical protein
VGECRPGEQQCNPDGSWGTCLGDLEPAAEVCDELDNDCNGTADDGLRCDCTLGSTESCGLDVGTCRPGTHACVDGQWGPCEGGLAPVPEQCDGLDNDCDGQTDDELIPPPASLTLGVCSGAVQICQGEAGWEDPWFAGLSGYEASEQTCDGLDNDCDGQIDEGLATPLASRQQGVCAGSRQVCRGGQGWQDPAYAGLADYEATETRCDGLDNDCDGRVDGASVCCRTLFTVQVPPETPALDTVYLAGSLPEVGSWDPAGLALVEGPRLFWQGEVAAQCNQSLEYKITRGSWPTVETDAMGLDIDNRAVLIQPGVQVDIRVAAWADRPALPSAETCRTAIEIAPPVGTRTFSGSTTNAIDDNPFRDSPDHWYAFTLQEESLVTISMEGQGWDTYLMLARGTCDAPLLLVQDDDGGAFGSLIDAYPVVSGRYFIIVGGFAPQDRGSYLLKVTFE